MPVQWQNMEIHIGGIEGYTDGPHIEIGKLSLLRNGRFDRPPKISKRNGYTELSTQDTEGSATGVATRLVGFKNEIVKATHRTLYSRTTTNDQWSFRGIISEGIVDRIKVFADQGRSLVDADMAIDPSGACAVVVWGGPANSIQGCIIDLQNEAIVNTISFSGAATYARVAYVSDRFIWTSWDGVSSNLQFATCLLASTWTFGTSLTTLALSTNYFGGSQWDHCATSTNEYAIIFVSTTANEPRINTFAVTGLGTAASDSVSIAETSNDTVAICAGTGAVLAYAAWGTATQVHGQAYDSALAPTTGALVLDASFAPSRIGLVELTTSTAFVLWERPEATVAIRSYSVYRTFTSAGATGTLKTRADWAPASKPWLRSGAVQAVLIYKSPDVDGIVANEIGEEGVDNIARFTSAQQTFSLHTFTNTSGALLGTANDNVTRWWGQCARGLAVAPSLLGYLPSVATKTTGIYEVPLGYSYRIRFAGTSDEPIIVQRGMVNRVRIDMTSDKRHLTAPWGQDELFITGARPSVYDGLYANEHGFATYPEFFSEGTADYSASHKLEVSAQDITDGVNKFTWCLVYEWQDANGNIIRSAPSLFGNTSFAVATTASSFGAILVTLYETLLRGSAKLSGFIPTDARIVPYRAVKDTSSTAQSAGPFYRDHDTGFACTYNTTITIGSTYSDEELIQQDQLYTTGDILDNAGTPPCKWVTRHGNRLWLGGSEDPEYLWFSQEYQEGEQPRFNEALRVFMGETIHCAQTAGQVLAAFGSDSIYVVAGDGPPATGGLDIGFAVEKLPVQLGCMEPRSLVNTPGGLMFQSRRGIEILDHSFQVRWVGRPVKQLVDALPVIAAATLHPTRPEVTFVCHATAGTGSSFRLVYNYEIDQWSQDVVTTTAKTAAIVWDGTMYTHMYGTTEPLEYTQGSSYTPDDETGLALYPPIIIETPWIPINTKQGWQRVRKLLVLFEHQTSFGLTVQVGYDYNDVFNETHTWTYTQIAALSRPQIEVGLTKQKAEAVRFAITETPAPISEFESENAPSAGPNIRSLVLECGFKKGVYKGMSATTHRK